MPSLPELEVYRQRFNQELAGQIIRRVEPLDFRVVHATSEALEGLLVGRPIAVFSRYGKWLIGDTKASQQLIIHLGLTGKLRVISPETPLPKYPCLVLHFDDSQRLVMSDQRHLGKVYVRNFEDLKSEKQLGPDLLSLPADYFIHELQGKSRAIRDVLMDQKLVAGIGGKYADEILWQAKLHPHIKISGLTVSALAQLEELAHSITQEAIALGAELDRFPDGWLIPHRHTDQICPRCHGPLSEANSVVHCPKCQPM